MAGDIVAHSFERYRATAAQRRLYGGSTVTKFHVYHRKDQNNAGAWLTVEGFGKTPGERKTDAIRRSGLAAKPQSAPAPALPAQVTPRDPELVRAELHRAEADLVRRGQGLRVADDVGLRRLRQEYAAALQAQIDADAALSMDERTALIRRVNEQMDRRARGRKEGRHDDLKRLQARVDRLPRVEPAERRPKLAATVERVESGPQVGSVVETLRFIPGSPTGIPSGDRVEIVETSKSRGHAPRYKVKTSSGATYWVDGEDISAPIGQVERVASRVEPAERPKLTGRKARGLLPEAGHVEKEAPTRKARLAQLNRRIAQDAAAATTARLVGRPAAGLFPGRQEKEAERLKAALLRWGRAHPQEDPQAVIAAFHDSPQYKKLLGPMEKPSKAERAKQKRAAVAEEKRQKAEAEKARRQAKKQKAAAAKARRDQRKADERLAKQRAAESKKAAAGAKRQADRRRREDAKAIAQQERARKADESAKQAAARELAQVQKVSERSTHYPSTTWEARFWAAVGILHPELQWDNTRRAEIWAAVVPVWRAKRLQPELAAQLICKRCEVYAEPAQAEPVAAGGRALVTRVKAKPKHKGAAIRPTRTDEPDLEPRGKSGRAAPSPLRLQHDPEQLDLRRRACPPERAECGYTVQGGTCTISARLSVPGRGTARTERIPARYCVVNIEDLITSNQPLKGFAVDSRFPPEAQERDYKLKAEAAKVQTIAEDYDPALIFNTSPGAIDGVPVANEDRVILGGNGRTMATALVYAERGGVPAEIPRAYLIEEAHQFGLTPEQVGQFKHPMLVRTIKTGSGAKELAEWSRRLNTSLSQELDATRLAVSRAKFVDEGTLRELSQTMGEDETLSAFLSSARSRRFVKALQGNGIIDARAAQRYIGTEGLLTDSGRDLVEDLLVAVLVPDAGLIAAYGRGPVGVLARAAPYFVMASQAPAFDVRTQLRAAVRDRVSMRATGQDDVTRYLRQEGLFKGTGSAVGGDERAKILLRVLNELDTAPVKFSRFARRYAELSAANPTDQGALFAAEKLSPLEALRQAAKDAGVKL